MPGSFCPANAIGIRSRRSVFPCQTLGCRKVSPFAPAGADAPWALAWATQPREAETMGPALAGVRGLPAAPAPPHAPAAAGDASGSEEGLDRRPIVGREDLELDLRRRRLHMQRPPSTSIATPVIMLASSEQRKAAALPISAGVEKRPSGMVARNLARI